MLDFLPLWAKNLIGICIMIYIGIAGFSWPSHEKNDKENTL